MQITRTLINGDRYQFDFKYCRASDGWAQVDTPQDASYFGTWANPHTLTVVSFTEGDVVVSVAETPAEFAQELHRIDMWNIDHQDGHARIDAACRDDLITAFRMLGLGDLLH